MKRIISLVLAGVLSLALLSSCGQKAPTLESLSEAIEKTEALASSDIDVSMNMKIGMMGTTIDSGLEGNIKVSKEGDKTVFLSSLTTKMGEESSTTATYYADGYMYTDKAGMKIKSESSEEEALKDASVEIPEFELNDETVKEFTTESVDGGYKCNLSFNFDKIKDSLGDILGGFSGTEDEDSEELINSSVSAYYVIDKNGYCSEYNVKFDATESDETYGESSVSIDMTAKYNNIGEKVEITAPADLDEYSENPYGDFGDLGEE